MFNWRLSVVSIVVVLASSPAIAEEQTSQSEENIAESKDNARAKYVDPCSCSQASALGISEALVFACQCGSKYCVVVAPKKGGGSALHCDSSH